MLDEISWGKKKKLARIYLLQRPSIHESLLYGWMLAFWMKCNDTLKTISLCLLLWPRNFSSFCVEMGWCWVTFGQCAGFKLKEIPKLIPFISHLAILTKLILYLQPWPRSAIAKFFTTMENNGRYLCHGLAACGGIGLKHISYNRTSKECWMLEGFSITSNALLTQFNGLIYLVGVQHSGFIFGPPCDLLQVN